MFKGIKGLFESKKGTLCLLILAGSLTALLLGKLEGMAFAGVVGTIGTIYCWTAHKVDCAAIEAGTPHA